MVEIIKIRGNNPGFVFGKKMHIDMKSLLPIAEQIQHNPQALRECETLCIESPDDANYGEEDPAAFAEKCRALIAVLDNLATHGNLKNFLWIWEPGSFCYDQPKVPIEVWASLAKNGATLKSMNVAHPSMAGGAIYEDSWVGVYFTS